MIGVDTDALADILCWVFLAGAIIYYFLSYKSPSASAKDKAQEERGSVDEDPDQRSTKELP